ncbi:MAG: hypothetical protein OQL18_05640 [Deltaproteobacteria bacterium]|nr:hypothetical protein [Deltaproteobacteria bacterium]
MEYRIQNTLLKDIGNRLSLINSTEDIIWFVDRNKRMLLANEATISTFKKARGIDIERGCSVAIFSPMVWANIMTRSLSLPCGERPCAEIIQGTMIMSTRRQFSQSKKTPKLLAFQFLPAISPKPTYSRRNYADSSRTA